MSNPLVADKVVITSKTVNVTGVKSGALEAKQPNIVYVTPEEMARIMGTPESQIHARKSQFGPGATITMGGNKMVINGVNYGDPGTTYIVKDTNQ